MCGIAGILAPAPDLHVALRMISQLTHRGPDAGYVWSNDRVVMGARRLSIINLEHGVQPAFSGDGKVVALLNGEIYNHVEIRKELEAEGAVIRDGSDVEVIPHAYDRWGEDFVSHFNGQFAIALWDGRRSNLLLARDRVGLKPLFYTAPETGEFLFASEIKGLFAHPGVRRELDVTSIAQIFTFWTLVDSHAPFTGIQQVPCGTVLRFDRDGRQIGRHGYWEVPWAHGADGNGESFDACVETFREKLRDAVRLRLRADVPVGTYTSGGVDSSVINHIATRELNHRDTETFSVAFENPLYDESAYQKQLAGHLGLTHNSVLCRDADIYDFLPDVIFHAEAPLFRTAPVPMYLLSRAVHERGLKVVLTGEGSDEVTWGYDIFRETKVRRFWAKEPESRKRPQLFRKMYGYLPQFQNNRTFNIMIGFFKKGLTETDDPLYSHALRITNSTATQMFFSEEIRRRVQARPPIEVLKSSLASDYAERSPLEKCQYLEMKTLLAGYLLSSQGDRMQNAHSVEGRCPYLDHHVIEYLATIPEHYRLKVLKDKHILREAYRPHLPPELVDRAKFAYRAPEMEAFVDDRSGIVAELLGEKALNEAGIFEHAVTRNLLARMRSKKSEHYSTRDNMAFVQMLSTQLLYYLFVKDFAAREKGVAGDFKRISWTGRGVALGEV